MRIGDAARASGVSVRALRHYEDEGLILPGRCSNGFRDYCQPTIDRVLAVRALLASGLPMRLILEALRGGMSGADVDITSTTFLCEVEVYRDRLGRRIGALNARYDALGELLRQARQAQGGGKIAP